MPQYTWMCLYKEDSEHALGHKYAKILNMAKFWIWQGSQYAVTLNMLYRAWNVSWVLNMPWLWIWQGSEYLRVTKGSK